MNVYQNKLLHLKKAISFKNQPMSTTENKVQLDGKSEVC
jgi:hypothetical protein